MDGGATVYLDKPIEWASLQSTVDRLIRTSESNSRDAKTAELFAVRDAISEFSELDARSERARDRASVANARLRDLAYRAFADHGGARAEFGRLWPEVSQRLGLPVASH